MVKRCCYGLCDTDSRYEDRLKGGVYFIPFPKKSNKEKCLKWIKACGRPHSQLNVDKINRSTYICSKHFINGGPSDRYPDPIPTENSPSITTKQKLRRKGKRLIKSNEKIPSEQLKDEPQNIKRTKWQPSPISLLDPSMDTVVLQNLERNPQKTDAIQLREGALAGKSECNKSQENVTEESGVRKQQLRALSCESTLQFLKDPTHVFNGEKVQFVKCLREADQIFDGLKKKEVWRLIYDFAVKYNNIIHNPICDFDGLGDSSWFQKFIERHPNVPIKKKNNSRASQKVNLNSNNVNTLQDTVPDLILAGSDPVTNCNIQMDNNKNSNSSPKSCLIKKDHPHVPESKNSSFWYKWLHDVIGDNVKEDDSVVLNSDVSQGECSGNYGSNQSGVNGETVTVKEEDFVAMEENSVFVKEEDLLGKGSDSAIIKDISEEENIIFIKNEDIHKEEESIFIKKEEAFEEAYEDALMNIEGPVCSKKRNSL
ncbi:uncharacterized protein LOC121855848 [Homarus americanus]|uniref:Putative THAP-like domain-containing protein 2 n=1 Tax=Homarus americanus TaxID=6706 RepID=A0A8J5N9Z1_HOMAM|nr:uncharacterized protein LOC121855848 [Homarus americanus]KAG7175796.1 putative THAP-like domain-containing protein 2 [Homarus americanus]